MAHDTETERTLIALNFSTRSLIGNELRARGIKETPAALAELVDELLLCQLYTCTIERRQLRKKAGATAG